MSKQIVELVKAALVARGQKWETNEDAFEITGRVAWELRNRGAMLIRKNAGQNGANTKVGRVSHDAIAFPTGWIDCLTSAGPADNVNGPTWDATGSSSALLVDPFDMEAGLSTPEVPIINTPDPIINTEPAGPSQLDRIESALAALKLSVEDLETAVFPNYEGKGNVRILGEVKFLLTPVGKK